MGVLVGELSSIRGGTKLDWITSEGGQVDGIRAKLCKGPCTVAWCKIEAASSGVLFLATDKQEAAGLN